MRTFPVCVIGLGSHHGDDRVGWEVVARLRDMPTAAIHLHVTSDPLAVADLPPERELLIVVDACRGAGPVGSVHRFEWPDSRLFGTRRVSSHAVGLVDVFRLAEALGKLPQRVVVFAIEAEHSEPGAALNPAVEAAIPEVVAKIRAEVAERTGGTNERTDHAGVPEDARVSGTGHG